MEKWYQEEYTWTVEVIGYLRGNTPEGYCRNGEEIGDRYTCTYGCPVNQAGQGICSKVMGTLFPLMEAVRSGGDLRNVGGQREVHQGRGLPRRLRDLPSDGHPDGGSKLFPRRLSLWQPRPLIGPGLRPSPSPRRDFMSNNEKGGRRHRRPGRNGDFP